MARQYVLQQTSVQTVEKLLDRLSSFECGMQQCHYEITISSGDADAKAIAHCSTMTVPWR